MFIIRSVCVLTDISTAKYIIARGKQYCEGYVVSTHVLDAIKSILMSNKQLLNPQYVTKWGKKFVDQAGLKFSPSFLVPLEKGVNLIKARKLQSNQRTCDLPECISAGSSSCSKCRSAFYCGAEHQKQHWKVHKKICCAVANGTTATSTTINSDSDLSIVFARENIMKKGEKLVTTSYRGGGTAVMSDAILRNIHGDNTFIVKIQVSMGKTVNGDMFVIPNGYLLIYDETKSFTLRLESSIQPQHGILMAYIVNKGLVSPTFGNIKCRAFLIAQNEACNIRVFMNRICKPQSW